ncbi:VOC family protein [Thiorhodococcus minor]|uniref:Glyoxalase n=1 Tax=Thiorhodococcus minor TaxID=57489 RepID=A0A6M0JZG7_9GAMM|nr:VOC family protein [Thiorhodococcus minor]NEV61495.1 glyoxalase [Thiorhodococcus minor]
MALVQDIHHVSLIVADTAEALRFYVGILGLQVRDDRPELSFPGAWLSVGDRQIHLLELPNPDPVDGRPLHGGRDRHLAMVVSSIDDLIGRLETAGLPFTRSRSGRRAVFCRDPDGNGLELIEAV